MFTTQFKQHFEYQPSTSYPRTSSIANIHLFRTTSIVDEKKMVFGDYARHCKPRFIAESVQTVQERLRII
jgi:hypothetical protein